MCKNYYKRNTNADEVGRTQGRSARQVSRRLLPAAGGRPEDGKEPLLGDQDQALKEVPGEGSSREAWEATMCQGPVHRGGGAENGKQLLRVMVRAWTSFPTHTRTWGVRPRNGGPKREGRTLPGLGPRHKLRPWS